MARCHFCGSKKDKYKCKTCGKSFCFEHTGSTDVYYCKNHPNVKLNRKDYSLQDKRCHVIEKSSCPKCQADLRVVHSHKGHKSVECTVCGWNSREKTPRIISKNLDEVLNEVKKHRLARSTDLCEKRLRDDKGEEFCLNCLINYAKDQREVLFADLKQFHLDPASAARTLRYLLREDLVEGMLDEKKQLFLFITINQG